MPNSTIQSTLQNPALFQADAWINGNWIAGSSRFAVDNPANGDVIAQVSNLGATEAKQRLRRPMQPYRHGEPKPPKSALLFCAAGLI
jgi:succinate-semialdehyde dehydrogenase / glutarate-semialdehyde dehydrogenase